MIKLSKTWIVIIIIILIIIGYFIIRPLFKSPTEGLIIEKVRSMAMNFKLLKIKLKNECEL